MKTCAKCGYVGGCGCVFVHVAGELICKACDASARGVALDGDVRAEMDAWNGTNARNQNEMKKKIHPGQLANMKKQAGVVDKPHTLKTCTKCGYTAARADLFEDVAGMPFCLKCRYEARKEYLPLELFNELEAARVSSAQTPVVSKMEKAETAPEPRFPDGPTLVYVGWEEKVASWPHQMMREYAASLGLEFFFVSRNSNFYQTASYVKKAAIVGMWNGNQFISPQAAKLCRAQNIPHFFIEWGMLPQKQHCFVDPRGMCGDSILMEDLNWVTASDMAKLAETRAQLQAKYPLKNEGFILVPLQIENDSQVLFYSKYKRMSDFVEEIEALYPDKRIIVRPHPQTGNKNPRFSRAEVAKDGDFLEWASRAEKVVGITSTTLYEAAILGVPVEAHGVHPLARHSNHNRVCAGALALRIPVKGKIQDVLTRFGFNNLRASARRTETF